MELDQQTQEQEDFSLAEIPSFPDDFNIDDINRQWEEMNHRSETRILPTA
ncbi:TPA: hypothetical protein IEP82_004949 [Escherichia coli]|nr:hypothetical protein [Escherichia coli]